MGLFRLLRLTGPIAAVTATLWVTACVQPPAPANPAAQVAQPSGEPTSFGEEIVEDDSESAVPTPAFTEQDLAPPSPTPSALPSGAESPAGSASPGASASGSASPVATAAPSDAQTPAAVSTNQVLPMAGAAIPSGLLSDQPLPAVLISTTSNPASRVGLGLVEQARGSIAVHDPDQAIRLLGRALSIDPVDPYIYFYLGRAYLAKQNYEQASTFFQRAAIGFATNAPWLGETYGFEGAVDEELGRTDDARAAYQKALAVAPTNQLAQQGYARVGPPPAPEPAPGGAGAEGLEGGGPPPPPAEGTPAPPPEEAPPPPAP